MAPTGRAAYILSEKVGFDASTIHRAIYKLSDTDKEIEQDEETDRTYFKLHDNDDSPNTIYFVDEASMISDNFNDNESIGFGSGILLKDLFKYVDSRKIVFIGDTAQLPPVGQSISPALDINHLQEKYNKSCKVEYLKTVVRQKEDSLIYKNAVNIRDSIDNKVFNSFSIKDGNTVKSSDDLVFDYFDENDNKINDNSIIITYTNKRALEYNKSIRKIIFDNDNRLNINDLLVIHRNNYAYGTELFNGVIVKVLDCDSDDEIEKINVNIKVKGTDNTNSKSNTKNTYKTNIEYQPKTKAVELCFRNIDIQLPDSRIIKNVKLLDNYLTSPEGKLDKDFSQALIVHFNKRYNEKYGKMRKEELNKYSGFHAKLIKEKYNNLYYEMMLKDPYYNALICKYGYAITCHKAQGDEWENVFVNVGGRPNNGYSNSDFFRWIYTAITRSKNKLWYYGAPTFNHSSNLEVSAAVKAKKMSYYYEEPFSTKYFSEKLSVLCKNNNIDFKEDTKVNYQHTILFFQDNDKSQIILRYGKDGYNGKLECKYFSNTDFKDKCINICKEALVPDNLNIEFKNESLNKLYNIIVSISKELDVSIVGFKSRNYQNTFYLQHKDARFVLEFYFNKKGFITYLQPYIFDGDESIIGNFCYNLKLNINE